MSNIIDYVKWRGDLKMESDGFNEVDNVILSRLSYFDFSKCLGKYEDELLLDEVYRRYARLFRDEKNILWKDDDELFPLMAISKRYQDLKLTRFVNNIDLNAQKQFSAITIILPDKSIFVSYRGTDNTLVGWKEDFNLSFQEDVPAQLESIKYLEEIARAYPYQKIRLGGHSKGGNLAIYSASFCENIETSIDIEKQKEIIEEPKGILGKIFGRNKEPKEIIEHSTKTFRLKDRITEIYNNDGPGLSDEETQRQGYKEMVGKMHSFIPQSSVIGRLLFHEENTTVVESTQTGILQHDVYSWQLEGNKFNHLDEVNKDSQVIDDVIKDWLKKSTNEEREKFVDMIYTLLEESNALTVQEMKKNWFESAKKAFKKYKDIDNETKEVVNRTLQLLWESTRESVFKKGEKKK